MLREAFETVYTKFKLHFYQKVFMKWQDREASLTTVETFCMEIIHAMNQPTVNEFAHLANISSSNAAYKVNNLVKKGYLKRIRSITDKREYHLKVTNKYLEYYNMSYQYVDTVVKRIQERFTKDEQETLEKFLHVVSEELMPEIDL